MLEIRYDKDELWLKDVTQNEKGNVNPTVDNMVLILDNDPYICNHILYNDFSRNYEYMDEGKPPRSWSDADDAKIMAYIESSYGIYNLKKYQQALAIVMERHSYNPLHELIENEKWDGIERIDTFLKDILKCDCKSRDMENYHREVSRMIFYGGIARLYTPGIKFDYMPILIGPQGVGKSTIIDWLALNTQYYKEVTTIDGDKGIECLEGGWICEFSELLAMTRQKDVQAMKAFVTRTVDRYRRPYDIRVSILPRNCIFIGTTNDSEFLTDTTGNRRYLPVEVDIPRGELFEHEKEIREYIIQCWREALYKMKNNKNFYLTIPEQFYDVVTKSQERRVIEDPRLSELDDFLSQKQVGDKVCSRMIWAEAFKGILKEATKGDFKTINTYMNKFKSWKRIDDNLATFEKYGRQKYWVKKYED